MWRASKKFCPRYYSAYLAEMTFVPLKKYVIILRFLIDQKATSLYYHAFTDSSIAQSVERRTVNP
jgi:hypothetical protein